MWGLGGNGKGMRGEGREMQKKERHSNKHSRSDHTGGRKSSHFILQFGGVVRRATCLCVTVSMCHKSMCHRVYVSVCSRAVPVSMCPRVCASPYFVRSLQSKT